MSVILPESGDEDSLWFMSNKRLQRMVPEDYEVLLLRFYER